jgi:hypothetical protein
VEKLQKYRVFTGFLVFARTEPMRTIRRGGGTIAGAAGKVPSESARATTLD